MSSVTDNLSDLIKIQPGNNTLNPRNALSSIKRARQCQRRKKFNIMPLKLDEIQKEIEEAVRTERIFEPPKCVENHIMEENKAPLSQHEDSFELNFAALSLNTPAKQLEAVKAAKFVTPHPEYRVPVKLNGALEGQYVTPNNKIPTKVQCSVKMQPYMTTPITKLYTASKETNHHNALKTAPLFPELNFKKIQVNNVVYIVLNELGKGGSSEVFHCFRLDERVHRAIKVVSLENKMSADGFINEVKILKILQRCNRIIKMFDFEIKEAEKVLLVVLEVGGTDFSKILKESTTTTAHMPLHMLLYYWMEMLQAVKQIHSNGIIHSDLKPANFLKVDGYLKLIDFGIATSIQNDMTSVVKSVPEGSFNYISPEALCNETSSNQNSPSFGKPKFKISCKSDVWSLGCILYQLVYRHTPFQHITQPWAKISAITDPNHKIAYPNVTWVPQKIINTIKACLKVPVKLRPSVDELIAEYENMYHVLS